MRTNRIIYSLPVVLLVCLFSNPVNAQYSEYEIKAAYIFNFAKFIEWPASKTNPDTIVLAIYGPDPFGTVLEKTMIGRKAQGKDWKIIRTNTVSELDRCHIVFIADVGKYETIQLIEKIKNKPILTIGDEMMQFCELGGIVNFTPQFSDQQFEINNDVAKSKGIFISPKLLLLAKIISNKEDEF
ncbi:MAG: YfiR family protein [Salinivirgaceae bacterium]|nr:YfiR family protein [Salinivirgaceae bacterium]